MKEDIEPADPPIDYPSALERTGGDEEFLCELLDMYISEFGPLYQQMKDAVDSSDFDSVRELAHSLKGASANLSLIELQETSYKLEISGKEADPDAARENLALLENEFKKLQDHLEKSS